MFCCMLLYVHSSIAIILMGKRELIALLNLSSWCLVMVERLFLAVPRGCLQFVIVVFPDHTHLLFFMVYDFGVLCPGAPQVSTCSGSGFKSSQKTRPGLKVSSDRLGFKSNMEFRFQIVVVAKLFSNQPPFPTILR